MGVAFGPGFPLQVLALPAHKPSARCGLFTAIPRGPRATSLKYILRVTMVFLRDSLVVTQWHVFWLLR